MYVLACVYFCLFVWLYLPLVGCFRPESAKPKSLKPDESAHQRTLTWRFMDIYDVECTALHAQTRKLKQQSPKHLNTKSSKHYNMNVSLNPHLNPYIPKPTPNNREP